MPPYTRQDAEGKALTVLKVWVAVPVLEDVFQRTLGVVDLGLEVVTLAEVRRVNPEASANREAPLIIRVTAALGERTNH